MLRHGQNINTDMDNGQGTAGENEQTAEALLLIMGGDLDDGEEAVVEDEVDPELARLLLEPNAQIPGHYLRPNTPTGKKQLSDVWNYVERLSCHPMESKGYTHVCTLETVDCEGVKTGHYCNKVGHHPPPSLKIYPLS